MRDLFRSRSIHIRMPIKGKYPADWEKLRAKVMARAGGRCECMGECGLHTTTGRCIEQDLEPARYARGRVMLTTAHLCQDSECNRLEHLRAMCQRCHLRYDAKQHARNARRTRRSKAACGDLFEGASDGK